MVRDSLKAQQEANEDEFSRLSANFKTMTSLIESKTSDLMQHLRMEAVKGVQYRAEINKLQAERFNTLMQTVERSSRGPDPAVAAHESILSLLDYRGRDDRENVIAVAHEKTSDWIEQDILPTNAKWDSLIQWLRQGHGCYWINGKAASGKSTLMKYLITNSVVETRVKHGLPAIN